ncbi:sporulation membrane protein YtaF [Bacillus alveayuensis]|jgi:putative sporulation protein YtaF|uniref:Sporulation protein YtaF n=1 Tax=Aeribacillus alveayuensis TaxID=279215 RepID=A0ABT9VJY0_9BACI|nr:sporulation membrane protein YtaF [Bacillus alveayuensis]MDQ0161100.1 putative sporulation protein YtaF [Bacillus alveayuensis]
MVQYASLFLLAFAVSLDSFSVGLTYGLRKLQIPIKSIIVIACCSSITLLAAMMIGQLLEKTLPPFITNHLGGFILICLGIWVIYQFFRSNDQRDEDAEKTLFNVEIKSMGIVIQILQKPTTADMDKSGTITGIEALLLGVALSLDAFGAGIGAALLGYSPLYMAILVAFMSSSFVFVGIQTGHLFSKISFVEKFSWMPGLLLILIGILKI